MGVIFKHRELEFQGLETPTYKLSAIVGADSFFYAIEFGPKALVHLETHFLEKPLALFQDPFDFLSDLMAQNPLLFESFDQKCFGIVGVPYVIVPVDQLRQNSPVRLLGGITHLAARDTVHVQQLRQLEAACIFAMPEALSHEVEMYFDAPVYQHLMGSLLEWLGQQPAESPFDGKRIHLHSIGPYALVIGMEKGKIAFQNQFRCVEIPDQIYFISAVAQDLQWSPGDFKLSVSGHRRPEILAHSDFSHIFSGSLSDLPLHTDWPQEAHDFLDLLAISRCAS